MRDSYEVGLWKALSKEWNFFISRVSFEAEDGSIVKIGVARSLKGYVPSLKHYLMQKMSE